MAWSVGTLGVFETRFPVELHDVIARVRTIVEMKRQTCRMRIMGISKYGIGARTYMPISETTEMATGELKLWWGITSAD